MTRLMTRIRPLTSPFHQAFRLDRGPRRSSNRRIIDLMALPGADERLITRSELDQLRRTMPNRVA